MSTISKYKFDVFAYFILIIILEILVKNTVRSQI